MLIYSLWRLLWFVVVVLAQTLILNQIHLFGYATPLLFIYFVISFCRNYPKWAILLWSFALGLSVDVFANTPGVAAASLTLLGAIQPYLLELFVPRDSIEQLPASAKALGNTKFTIFVTLQVTLFCFLYFALEAFSFFDWVNWLMCSSCSALLTILLILTLETLRKS